MFYFEDEPHNDGTFVHEAVQSLVGEVVDVAMPISRAVPVYPTRFPLQCAESRHPTAARKAMRAARSVRTSSQTLSISVSREEPTCPISTTFP